RRGGDSLLNEVDGLPEQRLGKTVHQESRHTAVQHHYLPVQCLQQRQRTGHCVLRRLFVAHHLHQGQHVHRLERMRDQKALRVGNQPRQDLCVDGGRAGGDH
ncbi:Sporulation protein, partial [Dysosmobacter welbionis]